MDDKYLVSDSDDNTNDSSYPTWRVIVTIIAYIFVLFFGTGIICGVFCTFIGIKEGLDPINIAQSLIKPSDYSQEEISAGARALCYADFIGYLVLTFFSVLFMFPYLKDDYYKIKRNPKFFFIFTIIATIIGMLLIELICFLVSLSEVSDSTNEELINNLYKYGSYSLTFISTVFLAPIVEEIIYRKCIFTLFRKFIPIAYIVSSLLFAIPHMLSTNANAIEWLLIFIPYLSMGVILSLTYNKSKNNIYSSIFLHMVNNLIASIGIIIIFII